MPNVNKYSKLDLIMLLIIFQLLYRVIINDVNLIVLFSPKSYNGSRVNKYIYIHVLYKSHINAELTSWKLIHNYDSGNIWQISIFDLTLRIEIPSSQFSNQWGYVHLYVTLTFSVVDVRTPFWGWFSVNEYYLPGVPCLRSTAKSGQG